MRSRRAAVLVHAVLMIAFWGASLALWDRLPERVPHHFGFDGQPTSWTRTSVLTWFGLPTLAVAMWLFLHGMLRLGHANPATLNIPEKDRFLRLPAEGRAVVIDEVNAVVEWVGITVTLCFAAVQLGVYDSATGRAVGFAWYVELLLWSSIAAMLILPIAFVPRIRRRVLDAEAAAAE